MFSSWITKWILLEIYRKWKLYLKAFSYTRKEHWTWSTNMAAVTSNLMLNAWSSILQTNKYELSNQNTVNFGGDISTLSIVKLDSYI